MATEPLPEPLPAVFSVPGPYTVPLEPFVSVTYKRSATIGKLVAALCKAQLAFAPVRKESENPAFARGGRPSKYADLYSLVSATRNALNQNGLTLMQFPNLSTTGKTLVVETLLAHESEEWISCELVLPAADERGFTAHSIGKSMTYARRYSWQAITGTVGEDDDDGDSASGVGSREAAQAVAEKKIAEHKAKKEPPAKVTSIFYTLPERHNGNYAEFLNLQEYTASNPDRAEELRLLFSRFMSKQFARTGTVMVPADKLTELNSILAGDMAIDVKELGAAREPGAEG
jgi:ERF superfamily